jgi:hypothetical protein
VSAATIAAVRAEIRLELARLTRLASTGRVDAPVATRPAGADGA